MIRPLLRAALPLLAIAAFAGCSEEAVERDTAGDARTAAGEVRGGTISDAMLPLDSLQSQSPPLEADPVAGSDGGSAADGAPAGTQSGEETDPDAAIDALASDMADGADGASAADD